ncbi:MAG TPA: cytochrome P450 [Pseudonocardiaceae bacterium]|nr:cytochrome P450 [Pseudonocardiaceae bacterium]
MVTVVQRWNIHPGIPWLRGIRPGSDVEYNEQLNAWFVYGYDAVFGIVNDPKTFSSRTAQLAAVTIDESFNEGDVSQLDPPEQTRYRKLISRAFTPKVVSGLQSRITQIADELLDAMRGKERIDLVAELAYPLPVIVIAELLGIPSTDRELFIAHSTRFIEQLNGLSFLDESAKEDIGYAVEGFQPMMDYMRDQLAERRRRPSEDLISGLAAAEQDGRRLTDNEIVNLSNLLLVAGHITTTMMIGNTVLCLDASPDQFARVREDRSLVPGALEESVRVLSPTAALSRRTTTEVEIAGVRVPEEQMLLPWLAAANRDPRRFADPDRFDAARDPNPHLGFGHGVHYCVGATLARVESRIAVNRLLDRFPKLYVDPNEPPEFFPNPDLIGVRSLPMRTG